MYVRLLCGLVLLAGLLQPSRSFAADDAELSYFARLRSCVSSFHMPKLPPARWLIRQAAQRLAEDATRAQAKHYGLHLPANFDPARPLVVLVHGFDSGPERWDDMARLLEGEGLQVARFGYPNDQAITESSALLAVEMQRFRAQNPNTRMHVIGHSMGCLVARDYVEDEHYYGGIQRLILLAPPNSGAMNVRWSIASEAVEHYRLWQTDPDWSWTWAITDGVGEAKRDLVPNSAFLASLNSRPRRSGVCYTIIAGNHHCACRYSAVAATWCADCLPDCWGFSCARSALEGAAHRLTCETCDSDGAVPLDSAYLAGVADLHVVPGDHTTLYCSRGGNQPVAWPLVRERLCPAHK